MNATETRRRVEQSVRPGRARGWAAWLAALTVAAAGGLMEPQAQETVIAYEVPAGTVGNQTFGGVLGMDFDVVNPIVITRLGVFDSGSDGLNLVIVAGLWDRATETELAYMVFTPDEPGELIGGSRFKDLPAPIRLEVGFQGTIAADGYGPEEPLRNRLGDPANIVWTTNDGNGSIAFVGSSRWGLTAGQFPATPDDGPAARYAAGTFMFQTTPALLPGKPVVAVRPGDGQVELTWAAVTTPLPAAKYEVFREEPGIVGPVKIGETEETDYVDGGRVNGVRVCYAVRAVSADGRVGPESDARCTVPYALAPNHAIAYLAPASDGNQAFGGSLGMDFDLDNPIVVKRLGVFDDGADGLQLPLAARIFDRTTQQIVAEVLFAPGEGELIEGMRFKALAAPARLEAGFQGVMQADGYGAGERLLNSHGVLAAVTWRLDDGAGSVRFVGSSRYGLVAGEFPDVADGGPVARYAAGTFEYEKLPPQFPGTPRLGVVRPFEDGAVTLVWDEVRLPLPAARYEILRAGDPAGPFAVVGETTTPGYRDTGLANGVPVHYQIRAVAAEGQVGQNSNPVSATPQPRLPGVAYIVLAGLAGNQDYSGSLGMDFDVARPVRVTELGVFDDLADGLNRALTAALYDRDTHEALARVEFTPENPGVLVDGSRFKPLAEPVLLPAGFRGVIAAAGYGPDEQFYNGTAAIPERTTFDGGSLLFVGSGRYGAAGEFPGTVDAGTSPNRYAAGTFAFEPIEAMDPPALTISRAGVDRIKIEWTGGGMLQGSGAVTGPWSDEAGVSSGAEVPTAEGARFYRVRQ